MDGKLNETEKPLLPEAGPWARCLARILDIWVSISIVAFLFGLFAGARWGGLPSWLQGTGGSNLLGILLLPFGLVIDAGIRRLFGNTPGKALLGLSVIGADGRPLGHGEYLGRNFNLWLRGLGLGLPLISLFTLYRQYQRLKAGSQASYDALGGCYVIAEPPPVGRKLAFGALFAVFLVAAAATLLVDPARLGQDASLVHGPLIWTNHYTGTDVEIDDNWSYRLARNAQGHEVEEFLIRDGSAFLIMAGEYLEAGDIDDYWAAFLGGTAASMQFDEHAVTYDAGRPMLRAVGSLAPTPDARLVVHITTDRDDPSLFWRIVTVQHPPHERSEGRINDLRQRMQAAW